MATDGTAVSLEDASRRARAKKSIADIFRLLQIARIVYVDDLFEDSNENALIGLLEVASANDPEGTQRLLPGIPFKAGVEAWDSEVRELWGAASEAERKKLLSEITGLAGRDSAALDYAASHTLRDLVPDTVPVLELAPSSWARAETELASATADARVLCLIDREFTYSEGRLPHGIADGIDLLLQAVKSRAHQEVIFGLFSHTFEPGEEITRWREIAASKGLGTDQFLPFSKRRQNNVEHFAVGLEMVALNMLCDRLKSAATRSMNNALEHATEEFRRIDVYEFEKVVLESSWTEGTWVPDTLFRVFQIFHRDAARVDISQSDTAAQVSADAVLAKNVSLCRLHAADSLPGERWKLRHQELFEGSAILNRFHSPLRSGDLFKGPGGRYFVLLAQPCDLAVRTERGARKSRYVTLVRVELLGQDKLLIERSKALKKNYDFLETRGLIPYIREGTDDVGLVRFSEGYSVAAELLDLAVLDPQGRCRIDTVSEQTIIPPQLSFGWRTRASELRSRFARLAEDLKGTEAALVVVEESKRAGIWRALMPSLAPEELKLPDLPFNGGIFDFKLQRVLHYREPGATRLLASYMRYLSRDAEDYDFAR